MFKAFLLMPVIILGFCSAPDVTAPPINHGNAAANWSNLSERLACLPSEGALIAAHRGTSRGEGLAENGLQSLDALINRGVRLVEVDVAQLRSGEHILFHDGVWEDKTTGRGTVASSNWNDVQKYLLKDETGRVTSDRPALLADYLRAAKGRAHVEIDFKSSAKYETVISAVREAGMGGDVILIAYSKGQAVKLSRLAPEMALSVPVKKIGDIKAYKASGVKSKNIYGWIGRGGGIEQDLKARGIPVLTSSRDRDAAIAATIVVSDYALDKTVTEGAIGLSKAQKKNYLDCLGN